MAASLAGSEIQLVGGIGNSLGIATCEPASTRGHTEGPRGFSL